MLSRLVKGQLVAFVVVTIVAVSLCAGKYLKVPEQLGIGRHTLTVGLPATGDLYPNALVTLRGVPIGKITSIELTETSVAATVSVDDDAPIAEDSPVSVRSVSAIGEQYLNFEHVGAGGRILRAGAVVPPSRVKLPTPDAQLLHDANNLLASMPNKDLNTTVNELGRAVAGRAGDLRWLIDSTNALVRAGDANLRPTVRLIDDLRPVLNTQHAMASHTKSISGNLRILTDQLRRSDADLRGTLEKTPATLREADALVTDLRASLPILLPDVDAVAQVLRTYLRNLQQSLVILPAVVNDLQSSIYNTPIPDAAKLSFKLLLNDSPPCTTGFAGQHQREPNDLSPTRPAVDAYCKEPHDSPIGVRMSRNAPCPNDPARRSRTASGCGLNFQSPSDARRSRDHAVRTQLEVAARSPKTMPKPHGSDPPDRGGIEARDRREDH